MTAWFRTRSFLAFLCLLFVVTSAFAQTSTARLEGIVTDNSGAPVPGATVTATNAGTSLSRVDVTDRNGAYTIPALPVGDYRVSVELSGFRPELSPVRLTVGQVARMDFRLRLGGLSEAVTVTAAAPMVEKSTSEISTLIDEKQIANLPLNGRNFTQLATLVPGVTRGIPGGNASGGGSGTDVETFRYSEFGGAGLSVNGQREQFNNFLIEGVDNNESLVNTIAYLPPPEAIREFSVITTNAPAEFGRAGGAIQNLVIKSGTNELHGSAYDFNRPRSLAATPEFAPIKPNFNNNDYGATLGGPIWRDRTFFFGSFHGLHNSIPIEAGNYVTVPTAKMRNGDFSELLDPSVSGLKTPVIIYNPTTGQPFANNMIPSSFFNAAGRAYLNAFPSPTRGGATHNYLTQRQKKSSYNDWDLRLDQTVTSGDQLFASGSHWRDQFQDPGRIPGFQAGFGAGTNKHDGYAGRLGETHVFSANVVNELRLGMSHFGFAFLPVDFGVNHNAELGIGGPGGINTNRGLALVGGGNGDFIEYLGDGGPYRVRHRTWQLSDSVTWLRSNHTLKFGGTAIRRTQAQEHTTWEKGFYFFRDAFGFSPGYTGYEVSDMLIGKTTFTATGQPGLPPRNTVSNENALFVQDDWHVNPKLTLNLGLRWDVFTPYYESDNRLANYNPATNRLVIPDVNGASRSTRNTNLNNFGPRLGFAYALNERTAIRGAYGVFYSLDRGGIANELTENPPANTSAFRFDCVGTPGACIPLSAPIPLPPAVDPNAPSIACCASIVYIPRNSPDTRVQQWSLSAQRELVKNTSAMLAYVGTRGHNLTTLLQSNVGFPLNAVLNIGSSRYDSVQATVRRAESYGLTYLASYTLGRARNNTAGLFPGNPSNFSASATDASCVQPGKTCNLSIDEGPADYDARHRFTLAATYELPWARGNMLVGGWNVNTVVTLQSGTPFTVYGGNGRAVITGDPNHGPKSVNEWFDTSVFKPGTSTAQGRRNAVRGPGVHTVDLSLFKTFGVPRYGDLELRLEAFNIFNWAQYNQPNQFLGDSNFGKITSTRLNSERQIQLGARYVF